MSLKSDSVLPRSWIDRLRPYLWAVLATGIAVWTRAGLTPLIGPALPFITLFPAVFVSAYLGGFGPALLTTVLGILTALYWFIEPVHSLPMQVLANDALVTPLAPTIEKPVCTFCPQMNSPASAQVQHGDLCH